VFVSSTFSDFKLEREAMQECVFPRLQQMCLAHGARFQAVDLRWGVSAEAGRDQQTMQICLREVERCQQVTPRPNFILLLGDRYGWRPLPAEIPEEEFAKISAQLAAEENGRSKLTKLKRRYRLDKNASDRVYVLRPRGENFKDSQAWSPVERELRELLQEMVEKLQLPAAQQLRYVASATEQETLLGALSPLVPDAAEHVFCFFRTIEGLPQDKSASGFFDVDQHGNPDCDARHRLDDLKTRLRTHLGSNVHEYRANWDGQRATAKHIDQLCDDVFNCVSSVIRDQLRKLQTVDPLEREILAHRDFGEKRAKHFIGRVDELRRIDGYLHAPVRHLLAITGISGSGKSTVIARAADAARAGDPGAHVICRFIGATPESSNGRALVESLCQEMSRIYEPENEAAVPTEFERLIEAFPQRLALASAARPLIVFLDALDQLSAAENARSLFWLTAELPEHVHVVVSTLQNDSLEALRPKLPPGALIELAPMSEQDGSALLDLWLAETGRMLQPAQRRELLTKFTREGRPLYLRLAFEEARLWRSHTPPVSLNPTIPGIIDNLFCRLSADANHGAAVVARSLGYLTAAKNGLTEDEMMGVLWQDESVKGAIEASPSYTPTRSLPVIVWSRLYFDLAPYLTWRRADGTSTLAFYHRQVREGAEQKFLTGQVCDFHERLARFFTDQELCPAQNGQRGTNLRKLSELPFQQACGEMWSGLNATLTDFAFIQAKVSAVGPQAMIEDYDLTAQRPDSAHLASIQKALQLSAHALALDASQLPGQLLGRLLSQQSADIQRLLAHSTAWEGASWLQPITASLTAPGGRLLRTLRAHAGYVNAVALIPRSSRAISASSDGTLRIWNLEDWSILRTLTGHTESVRGVAVTLDGRRAVSCSEDTTVRVWDLENGAQIHCLGGHEGHVVAVAVTPDGRCAITGSMDKTLKVWDLKEGGASLRTLRGHEAAVQGVVVASTPYGMRAISGSVDKTVRIWDLETGVELKALEGHAAPIIGVAVTPDGRGAVSASVDESVLVWDIENFARRRRFTGHRAPVAAVAVHPDGRRVASAAADRSVRIWDIESARELAAFTGHSGWVTAVAFTPDGRRLLSGSDDRTIRIWDLEPDMRRIPVATTPDGRRAISTAAEGHALKLWDLERGAELLTMRGHTGQIHGLALTRDGRRAVSASEDGTVRVWQLATGEQFRVLPGHGAAVLAVAMTADGQGSVSASADGMIRFWDLETGTQLHLLVSQGIPARAVTITADGRKALSGADDGMVRLWNLETGTKEAEFLESASVFAVAMKSDGRRAVFGCANGSVRICNLQNVSESRVLMAHADAVVAVAITDDGLGIISASRDLSVKFWDGEASKLAVTIHFSTAAVGSEYQPGHGPRMVRSRGDPITGVAFISGGTRAIFAAQDGTITLWKSEPWRRILALPGHTNEITSLATMPDDRHVLSVSADRALKLWDIETGAVRLTLTNASWIRGVAVTSDGKKAITASSGSKLTLWDLERGTEIFAVEKHLERITVVAMAQNGRVVSLSDNGMLRIWDLETREEVARFSNNSPCANALKVTRDGARAVVGLPDGTIKTWDLRSGSESQSLRGHGGAILSLTLTSDDRHCVSSSADNTLRIWDLHTAQETRKLTSRTGLVHAARLTPNQGRAICSWEKTLVILDLDTGKAVATFSADHDLCACAVSHDGRSLAAGDASGRLHFLSLRTPDTVKS
jgi:WD40 repeat protein